MVTREIPAYRLEAGMKFDDGDEIVSVYHLSDGNVIVAYRVAGSDRVHQLGFDANDPVLVESEDEWWSASPDSTSRGFVLHRDQHGQVSAYTGLVGENDGDEYIVDTDRLVAALKEMGLI